MLNVEQVRKRTNGEDVGVEEDDFIILSEAEYMQFCKDSVEIRTT